MPTLASDVAVAPPHCPTALSCVGCVLACSISARPYSGDLPARLVPALHLPIPPNRSFLRPSAMPSWVRLVPHRGPPPPNPCPSCCFRFSFLLSFYCLC